jgi:hypothetical protein
MGNVQGKIQELAASFAEQVAREVVGGVQSALADVLTTDLAARLFNGQAARIMAGRVGVLPEATPQGPGVARAKPGKPGRLPRRTPEQINRQVDQVAKLLVDKPVGLRAEAIRDALGLDTRELPRILKEGIAAGKFAILRGHKRSTTYGVESAKPVKPTSAKKGAKRTAKKKKS